MFSPWSLTVDAACVRLLEAEGWQMPPANELPTGNDLVERYLEPLAAHPAIQPHLKLGARIEAVSRRHIDKMKDAGREDAPFVLHVIYSSGEESIIEAKAVIDASGTWHKPNPVGAGGLFAAGEKRNAAHIHYGIPNIRGAHRARYAGKRVMVAGSGHSAVNALLDLAELQRDQTDTAIYWVMRGTNLQRVFGGGSNDALPARGSLGTRIQAQVDSGAITILSPFRIREIIETADGIAVSGETDDGVSRVIVDEIIAATGARPDIEMLRELRLDLDPALESTRQLGPLIDPNIHSCGTVRPHGEAELRQPEKNFYIAGMKSYGRAPTFLLATGYEQVRSIVAALTGDWDAARDVQLVLPETGVCNTDLSANGACCGSNSTEGSSCGTVSAEPALLSLSDIQLRPLRELDPRR
jgi:thioredoxin reductase